MKSFAKRMLPALLGLVLLASPLTSACAEEDLDGLKPVAVVSVASIDELLADVDWMTQVGGAGDVGGMIKFMARGFTAGIDRAKSSGGYVTLDEQMEPKVVGFIPVTDLKKVLLTFQEQVGKPEDAGDGVLEIGTDQPRSMFIKEQDGWAYFSEAKDNLVSLPKDPSKLMAEMDAQYDVAVRVFMKNIPAQLKKMAVTEMKAAFERSLEQQLARQDADEAQREIAENVQRNVLKSIATFIEESDQITVGWAVDTNAKTTYLDFGVTAVEGTSLARRMALVRDTTSDFAGFLLLKAAATLNFSSRLHKDDIQQISLMLQAARERLQARIEKDKNLQDQDSRDAAKQQVGILFDVLLETVRSGKLDGGAAFRLESQAITFAAGGYVADGPAVEEAVKKLVNIAKQEPEFPEGVKFSEAKHGDIRLHKMSIPLPADEQEARQFLGDQLDVVLGIGETSVYLAVGKDSEKALKHILDKSASSSDKVVPPSQLNVSLAPILKFFAEIDQNPLLTELAAALAKSEGQDRISITSKPIERGAITRLELQQGVLESIGIAVKQRLNPEANPGF